MSMPIQRCEAPAGLPELILQYGPARVRLALQGAQVLAYVPEDRDLLWLSGSARFDAGLSIRGGIPLCWPWFGASPDLPGRPQHGFARTAPFRVVAEQADAQATAVTLALDADPDFPEWRVAARLEVELRLSDCLWMEVRTTNIADRELLVGTGLHNYFRVSDSRAASIPALTGLDYLDKTEGDARGTQRTPLRIEGEVDRVYLAPPPVVDLLDPRWPGRVRIEAWGHTDLVVWNPGPAVARSLADFDDDGYRAMLCIEPAQALDNRQRLAPGACHTIGQRIRWLGDEQTGRD